MSELLKKLSPSLKVILESELAFGNNIAEISSGWPETDSIIVLLEKRFHNDYQTEGINYLEIEDRHYWCTEYSDPVTKHTIAAGFK